jgi:hypothetical protein
LSHGKVSIAISALLIKRHATLTVGANGMGKVIRTLFMAGLAISLASPGLSKAQDEDTHGAGAVFVMTNASIRMK